MAGRKANGATGLIMKKDTEKIVHISAKRRGKVTEKTGVICVGNLVAINICRQNTIMCLPEEEEQSRGLSVNLLILTPTSMESTESIH